MNVNEISRSVIKLVMDFPDEYRSKILKLALLANQPTSNNHSKIIENFSKDTNVSKEQIFTVLGVYIGLLRLFLENTDTEFKNKVIEIGFSSEFAQNLPLIGYRDEIINNLRNNFSNDFGKILILKWKIDISLSNSALLKKAPITVILCLTLKNGEKYTIEVEAKLFHKLRFNIALILKELNMLPYSNK